MGNKEKILELQAGAGDAGSRLDVFLTRSIGDLSRSRIKKLINEGLVLVDRAAEKASYKLSGSETVSLIYADSPADSFEPEDIPLDIVFEDDALAVVNKPAGMIVHPGAGVREGTLANAIAYHFGLSPSESSAQPGRRVGIVHRLDKNTSGLILVAKDDLTHESLSRQFSERSVKKSYIALVHGHVRKTAGTINAPIGRDRQKRVKMAVTDRGRSALSRYRVSRRFERFTLLDVEIETGRTHQIRVHLAHINHPIVGDTTYNEGRDKTIPDALLRRRLKDLDRFFLHSARLSFTHPVSDELVVFEAGFPSDLTEFLTLIG